MADQEQGQYGLNRVEWKAVNPFNYFLSNRFSMYAGTMPEIMTEIFELHTISSRYSPR